MGQIKVLVVDDDALFRRVLCESLELEKDIQVVGEAANGEEAISKAQELIPDVILMDVKMPKMNGAAATRYIKSKEPKIKVIMLSAYVDKQLIAESLQAGANAYLLKDQPLQNIIRTIRIVCRAQEWY
ncbi:MAG: response regulator transcription factor [Actinomycetota bacterium]|nr:response regulator transcription factor [Actinomycetota bacterium]